VSLVNAGRILSSWSWLCRQLGSPCQRWRLLTVSCNIFTGCKQGQFDAVYEDKGIMSFHSIITTYYRPLQGHKSSMLVSFSESSSCPSCPYLVSKKTRSRKLGKICAWQEHAVVKRAESPLNLLDGLKKPYTSARQENKPWIGMRIAINSGMHTRPLSRRIPPPQPAGTLPRRRRRKKFGAPPRQPKFTDAAAATIFAARRSASDFNSLWHMQPGPKIVCFLTQSVQLTLLKCEMWSSKM